MSDDQFSLFEGRAARAEALTQVEDNSGDWMTRAYRALLTIEPGTELTGEDVRRHITDGGCSAPHHPNAWGALIRVAVVRGALSDTGRMTQMKAVKSHARRTPVYRRAG